MMYIFLSMNLLSTKLETIIKWRVFSFRNTAYLRHSKLFSIDVKVKIYGKFNIFQKLLMLLLQSKTYTARQSVFWDTFKHNYIKLHEPLHYPKVVFPNFNHFLRYLKLYSLEIFYIIITDAIYNYE